MSLMEALAEVVVNVAATKGGGAVARSGQSGGGLFGQLQGGGGLEDLLGAALGGRSSGGHGEQTSGGVAQDGLGGLLESLARGSGGGDSGSGLDDLLGQLIGGSGGGAGTGLGQIIGAVTGALSGAGGSKGGGSFGDLLNQAISNRGGGALDLQPTDQQEVAAGLMLRAIIQAAKSDGKFDRKEQEKLLGRLGDVSSAERQFVTNELNQPIDIEGLVHDVPRGLEPQVYAMSVMGIDLDNQTEAQYLDQLAKNLDIDEQTVNAIHAEIGAPALYR